MKALFQIKKAPELPPEIAEQILQNAFDLCVREPNSVPLETLVSYSGYRRERYSLQRGVIVCMLALFLLSFVVGRYGVPLGQVVRILLSGVLPLEQTWTDNMAIAVLNVRLPRILLACLVGCGLSAAGTGYQTVFQNPMAAPDILGASSGA